jgi:hypothetical protein
MDERAIRELLKRRYPEVCFKVKLLPFGMDSKVLVIRTSLYNEKGEEAAEEIKNFLKKYSISEQFYCDQETGKIFAGEIAFIIVAPFDDFFADEEGDDGEASDSSI